MRRTASIWLFSAFPALALAAGDHGGHDMSQMRHDSEGVHSARVETYEASAGHPGDPAKVSRTIEVRAEDTMRFSPEHIQVKAGETVRIVLRNAGMLQHELVIGTPAELQEHAAMMRTQPSMRHDEPNMISAAPGQSRNVVWQFDRAGTVEFACLVPGHLESGMVGKIEVE